MSLSPDEQITIDSVRNGNQAAYEILVKRYERYVFTLVMQYVRSREVAEELSQDVFLKAYRSLGGFQGRSKFSTWLYTIVNSVCLSYLKTNRRQDFLPGEEKLTRLSDNLLRQQPGIVDMDNRSWNRLIAEALDTMPTEDCNIITLFYQAEQSVAEIAQVTGLSTANVKVRLFRGRQKLKELLAHAYKEYQQ